MSTRVAHCKRYWLSPTETALDRLVRGLRRYSPIVFAQKVQPSARYGYPVRIPGAAATGVLCRLSKGRIMSAAFRDWLTLEFLCSNIELVHCHFATEGIFFSRAVKAADLPLIVSCHGHDVYRFPRVYGPVGRLLLRRLFYQAALFTAVSDHMRKELIELGCPPEKVRTVRVGVDVSSLPFRPRSSPTGKIRIACVAAFKPKKGLTYLLEAFSRLCAVREDLELIIVGDGGLRPDLERKICEHGLSERVRLTGWLQPREVAHLLDTSHLYVQPSITADDGDREGIPASIMEAMALGLPVVATRHAGIPELVEHESSGLLVPEKDAKALADAISALISQPELWQSFGERGRNIITERHDIARQIEEVELIYDELTEANHTAVVVPIGQVLTSTQNKPAA